MRGDHPPGWFTAHARPLADNVPLLFSLDEPGNTPKGNVTGTRSRFPPAPHAQNAAQKREPGPQGR